MDDVIMREASLSIQSSCVTYAMKCMKLWGLDM
jgi:hypothetical protein